MLKSEIQLLKLGIGPYTYCNSLYCIIRLARILRSSNDSVR